ncbi:MAG: hypothetical protein V1896_02335 [Candidatus Zambryskibacteria bacterium]
MKKLIALVAVAAFVLTATPALAWYGGGSEIEVENDNHAVVINDTTAVANTGGNTAYGSGGVGGNAMFGSNANGGSGSNSGDIDTGTAVAKAKTVNVVNSNVTSVKVPCRCKGDIEVENDNGAFLKNDTVASADTGYNIAGGDGGNAGTAKFGSNANGGSGSNSGDIDTGTAVAKAKTVNVVNTNLTRIRR